jgi:hypothetical protein
VVHLLKEAENVTVLTAAEAVIPADLWSHVKARAALVVEGTQALERTDTRTLERHIVSDDVGDIDARTHLVDIVSSNEAGHPIILLMRADYPTMRACHTIADWSVSEATWSTTARLRPASVVAARQSAANPGSRDASPRASRVVASSVRTSRCWV